MTEKVVLTKEQAEAIERWADKEQLIIAKVVGLLEHGLDEPLYTLTTKELIQALYIGYEVEPEFKVGDWVTDIHPEDNVTGVITKIDTNPYGDKIAWGYFSYDDIETNLGFEEIRHATPSEIAEEKERIWWKRHGRDVWELEEGDLLKNLHNKHVYEILNIDELSVSLDDGLDYRTKEDVKKGFMISCFYQNRLDVKTND